MFEAQMNDFEIFWSAYPEKKSKGQARRTWEKLKKKKILPSIEVLLKAIEAQKQERMWKTTKKQFVPSVSLYRVFLIHLPG
jgi:hypothetical protein